MEWGFCTSPGLVIFLWTLLLRCFDNAGLRAGILGVKAESLDVAKMSAVTGGDASLPCDTRSSQPKDVLQLVAWYRDDHPIYSYDSRREGPEAHWSDPTMADRARWHPAAPSSLRIRDVVPTDRALYRCRVDFKISPTANHKVLLDVIELPEKPKIFDDFDKEIVLFAGPYVEDSNMKLTCVVSGGKPAPRVRWLRNDQVVSTLPLVNDGSRISMLELRVPKLTRDFYEAVYSCTADNTLLAPPQKVNVQIQLYLRPLFVEILTKEQPLSVDQRAELTCRAVGSRPPALITWWLDNMQISSIQKDSVDLNETLSVLRWTPRMEHNGKTLVCRASHEKLEQETIETSMTLNLHYVPIAKVQLGSNLNPNDIEENDDVYFECLVEANPPAYKVVWEHNGHIISHNQQAGVITGSSHLALQEVKRGQAGTYSCIASNVEGDGRSPIIDLQVIYKPACKTSVTMVVGAAINEPARISCEVDAYPKPNNFQWTVNSSAGSSEVEYDKFTIADGRSLLTFTPTSEADYGIVSCRASNMAGQQLEPCRFSLLPAVRPDPLTNCSTNNLTDDSAELRCMPGYNGGLHTIYFVEAWDSGRLILNLSNPSPVWRLRGLGPEKDLQLNFYAHNARGRSESAFLEIHTLSRLALQIETYSPVIGMTILNWILGILSGVAGTLVSVIIIALLARRCRHQPIQYAAPTQMVKTHKASLHSEHHSPVTPDEKNPDVVPLGKDLVLSPPSDTSGNLNHSRELPPNPPPYRAIAVPHGFSRSVHSLHHEPQSGAITPSSDALSIGTLGDDWRSIRSGTLLRGREVVTTRTPLLGNAQESCV